MAVPCIQVEKCEKCLNYYPTKSVHQCMLLAVQEPRRFKKILPAEKKESPIKILSDDDYDDDDDDGDQTKVKDSVNDFNSTSCLINAIKVRRPLFDHTMSLSERSESIKNKLWIEVYNELQGQVSINELKKKWKYLKEKYVRERQKLKKCGLKGGRKTKWLHYVQLSFLEEIIIQCHVKKTTSNLNLDKYSEDSPQNVTTAKKQIKKERNDNNLQRHLLNEHKMARSTLQTEVIEEPNDSDVAFGKYLVALMKDLPNKKRKTLQCQFIESVVTAQDL